MESVPLVSFPCRVVAARGKQCWKNVYLSSRIIVHPSHPSPRVSNRTFIYLIFYLFSFYIYLISRIIVDRRILYLRDTFCLTQSFSFV